MPQGCSQGALWPPGAPNWGSFGIICVGLAWSSVLGRTSGFLKSLSLSGFKSELVTFGCCTVCVCGHKLKHEMFHLK